MRIHTVCFLLLLTACAHHRTESVKKSPSVAKKTRTPDATTKDQREAREFARERSSVIAKKRGQSQIASLSNARLGAYPQRKKIELQFTAKNSAPVAEKTLLAELTEHYERNDELGFQSRYQAFVRQYPKSPSLAKAHYTAGLLALANKNYGPALRSFDLVLQKSPRSPHASPAMFAKAIAFKRMNLREPSVALLRKVQASYPKSLEAQRASLELKLQEKQIR